MRAVAGTVGGILANNTYPAEFIEEQNIVANTAETGAYLRGKLGELQEKYPLIGDVRGMGLLYGMELVRDRKTKEPATAEMAMMMELTRQNRILIGKGGKISKVVPMCPHVDNNEHSVQIIVTLAALKLQPTYAPAHNNLALALGAQGRKAEAIGHLREAVTKRLRSAAPGVSARALCRFSFCLPRGERLRFVW